MINNNTVGYWCSSGSITNTTNKCPEFSTSLAGAQQLSNCTCITRMLLCYYAIHHHIITYRDITQMIMYVI
jgi:hypothetical protein